MAFVTSTSHVAVFDPERYWPDGARRYVGRTVFTKHLHPGRIGVFDSQEEEQCAVAIDIHPKVKRWVRNLVRRPDAFGLATSKDWFYPDFVAELTDGRVLVVEYKGAMLADARDTHEKRLIGERWARASGDQCLFVMVQDRDYGAIDRTIAAATITGRG